MESKDEQAQPDKGGEYITYRTARWMVSRAVSECEARRHAEEYAKVEAAAKEKAQTERDNDQWFMGYINGVASGVILMIVASAVAYILTH